MCYLIVLFLLVNQFRELLNTSIKVIGFEPTTTRSQNERSNQTELHSENMIGTVGLEPTFRFRN